MKNLNNILHSKCFYVLLVVITLVYSLIYFSLPHKSIINPNQNTFIGIITNYKIAGDLLTIEIKGEEKVIGYYYFKTEKEKDEFNLKYELGDEIQVKCIFKTPSNNTVPNLFNYKKYLERKNIYYQIQIESISMIKKNNSIYYKVKNAIGNHMDNMKSKAYLYALILGNKDFLDSEIKTAYQELGISHLLAISGMQVSMLSSLILFILKKIHISYKISYAITILFSFLYMSLLGNAPSILRAVLFFSILGINKIFKLKFKILEVWCMVFMIVVCQNPNILFDVGFQYSFLISFFLIIMQSKLKGKTYLKSLFLVSIISFFVGLPITLYSFYQINILSIIINLFFVPYVSYIISPLCLLTLLLPFLDQFLMILLEWMENLTYFFYKYECFKIVLGKPSLIWIIIYYVALTLICIKNKKNCSIVIMIILIIQFYQLYIFSKNYFIMIDVGQGDSMLMHSNGKTMLLDTGGRITYQKELWQTRKVSTITDNTLIPLLKSLGIRKLDYLLLSHGDYDHMGEAINLVENFKVEKVIFNCGEYNELEQDLIKVLDKRKIPYYSCIKELNIDDNKLYFLNNKDYGNENDNSSVIYAELNNHKFLFMGDAGVEVEEDLLKKYNLNNIDVLKVGHHGSKTSTSEKFIDTIKPKYSVISVGKNNRYGHPNDSVLNNLKDSEIYRTDQDGSIMVKIKNNKLEIEACAP